MGGAGTAWRICGGVALNFTNISSASLQGTDLSSASLQVTDIVSASKQGECPSADPGGTGILPAPERARRNCHKIASSAIEVLSGSLERGYA